MKILTSLVILFLTGCATTTVTATKLVFPDVPAAYMVPAIPMAPITADQDGSVDPKAALSVIISNNANAKANADELNDLQKWIKDTQNNIKNGGKLPDGSSH